MQDNGSVKHTVMPKTPIIMTITTLTQKQFGLGNSKFVGTRYTSEVTMNLGGSS